MRLAGAGVSTTIVGRNEEQAKQVIQQMTLASQSHGNNNVTHSFLKCDAFSLKNIKEVCDGYSSTHKSLDYLVLTQGIGTMQSFTPTAEVLFIIILIFLFYFFYKIK